MKTQSYRRLDRVTKRSGYTRIYEQGVWKSSKFFTIITCGNPLGHRRLGITVTKKAGNAVKRNRIKRLIREFFRLHKDLFPENHDTVVMAKKNMPPLTYLETCKELTELLQRNTGR